MTFINPVKCYKVTSEDDMRNAVAVAALLAGTGAAWAEVPKVAADITPVHGLVARVMQGLGEPSLVVQPGATPHG
jgi:zinc transport system substrate-binding protein